MYNGKNSTYKRAEGSLASNRWNAWRDERNMHRI